MMMRCGLCVLFLLTLVLNSSGLGQSTSGVVINEVFTGNPDWIEIRNLSGASRDIGGWTLDATFAWTSYPTFTFPPGTSIAPGESIVVVENSNPAAIGPVQPPLNTQVFTTNFGYGWIGTSAGAVALANDSGTLQDMVGFGITGYLVPATALNSVFTNPVNRLSNDPSTGNVLFRNNMSDTDDGLDWGQSSNGFETPGMANPGQVPGPQPTASLLFSGNSGIVSIDPNTHAVTMTAIISGLILEDGRTMTDPSWDLIIGGQIQVNATAVTSVAPDYAGLIWTPTAVVVTTSNGEKLTLQGIMAAEVSSSFALAGPLGTQPMKIRSMSTRTMVVNNITGASSPALTQLHQRLQHDQLHFVTRFENGGARMVSLDITIPPAPRFTSRLANGGSGSLQIGVIGASQGTIYNVFVVNPAYSTGTGSIYGIEWGLFQWQQVATPLGTQPFHVAIPADGTWFFQSPNFVVPSGIFLDHVSIEIRNGIPIFSPPTRAWF